MAKTKKDNGPKSTSKVSTKTGKQRFKTAKKGKMTVTNQKTGKTGTIKYKVGGTKKKPSKRVSITTPSGKTATTRTRKLKRKLGHK